MKDRYDEHIEAILGDPNPARRIGMDWRSGCDLFQYLTPSGRRDFLRGCGCPTMIKTRFFHSFEGKLDAVIKESKLIPDSVTGIKADRAMLEEFARIQRLADKIYGRV